MYRSPRSGRPWTSTSGPARTRRPSSARCSPGRPGASASWTRSAGTRCRTRWSSATTTGAGRRLPPRTGSLTAYAEVHGAAFGGKAITGQWRERILGAPLYQPDLDLVAVAPDGTLAGFCVGWHEPAHGVAQFEPVGVHPRYQRQGLGRALLTEMLYCFQRRGARVAIVETDFARTAARAAYRAVGFVQAHTIWRQEARAADVS